MEAGVIVMVGFGQMLLTQLDHALPPASVLVVEDPDIIPKRAVREKAAHLGCVADVVPAMYHQDTSCAEVVERHLAGRRVRAVLPGLEYGVLAAATLAERWGSRGASVRAATCLTDKLRLREAAAAAGLRQPAWREIHGPRELHDFADGQPVVLKPANRHASLGVQLLEPGDDLDAAWKTTVEARDQQLLPDRPLRWRYLAERRVSGQEYSVEALVRDGRIVFVNVTEKLTAGGRYPVELGHVVPAPLPDRSLAHLRAAMTQLAGATGFVDGVLHAEWMLDHQGPTLIECAGRLPGDSIIDLIDAAYGTDLVGALIDVLTGREPRLPSNAAKASAIRFLTAPPGRITRTGRVQAARTMPGVVHARLAVTIGDTVRELRSSWDRIGEVLAVGPTPDIARHRAERAAAEVRVDVQGHPAAPAGALAG